MESLAYLVAFILACIVIGGPLALALTFIRVRRYRAVLIRAGVSILLGAISTLLSSILILNTGSFGSKVLGFLGLATGIPAIVRSVRSIRDFR